jgi:2-dehydro-3-deoxy-D-arabinonate dehydratase
VTIRLRRQRDLTGRPRWLVRDTAARSEELLPEGTTLASLVRPGGFDGLRGSGLAADVPIEPLLAPVDPYTEVWAAGVTYERSLQARAEESVIPDVYDRVYAADRPEIFFKAVGWRVSGPGQAIAVRADSAWNVPEPELAVVLDPEGKIFGWTICNDVSSRSIEAENPLYLPQAKTYLGSCALGPWITLAGPELDPADLSISLVIERAGAKLWQAETSTRLLHRGIDELSEHLFRADVFPAGVVLATGTGLVPPDEVTLSDGDVVRIAIAGLGELANPTVVGWVPDARQRAATVT